MLKAFFQSALFLTTLFICGTICSCNEHHDSTTEIAGKNHSIVYLLQDSMELSLSYLDELHERKTLKNRDRSFEAYMTSIPNCPDSVRKVVYLLPFGNMKPEVEMMIRDELSYLEAFLQMPVKMLNRVTYDDIKGLDSIKTRLVPDSDFDHFSLVKGQIQDLREQIEARSFINNYMVKHIPKDAVTVLGITEHDIYNPGYNYLIGSSISRVGLISTFRIIDYGEQTRYNIRKAASKQLVNTFSINNVKDYNCLLNFHNSLEELLDGKFSLSPRALEKLKYCIGFDYDQRFKQLAELWRQEGNPELAAYYDRCIILGKMH